MPLLISRCSFWPSSRCSHSRARSVFPCRLACKEFIKAWTSTAVEVASFTLLSVRLALLLSPFSTRVPAPPLHSQTRSMYREMIQRLEHIWKTLHPAAAAAADREGGTTSSSSAGCRGRGAPTRHRGAGPPSSQGRGAGAGAGGGGAVRSASVASTGLLGRPPVGQLAARTRLSMRPEARWKGRYSWLFAAAAAAGLAGPTRSLP